MAGRKAKEPKPPKKDAGGGGMSVSAHPRAAASIRRTRGWGGIAGLVLVGWLSHRAGLLPFDVALRALAGGIAGYVVMWMIAVQVWRHLVVAEVRAAIEARRPRAPDPGEGLTR